MHIRGDWKVGIKNADWKINGYSLYVLLYTLQWTTVPPTCLTALHPTDSLTTNASSTLPLSSIHSTELQLLGRLCLPVSLSACCCCYCCCPPPTPRNQPSPLYTRKHDMIDTQVGIVAPFAYSTGRVASPIFIPLQKILIKKRPNWQPEWWRCRKQPTLLYLKTQTPSCLWNFSSGDTSRAAESRENSLTLPRLNTRGVLSAKRTRPL